MPRAGQETSRDQARIALDGERVDQGIGLAVLGRTLNALSDALRLYARSRRGEPLRRIGTPTAFDEAVTDLRLVGVEDGSVELVLEEPPLAYGEIRVPHVAIETLDALLASAAERSLPVEVADALERTMAPLGRDATIRFARPEGEFCVQRGRAREFSPATSSREQRPLRIVGRLRALDLDKTRIGIRTTDGTLWACAYPDDLATTVIEAINRVVIAHGVGAPPENGRGQIALQEIEIVPETVQTSLFSREPASVSDLAAAQRATPGRGLRLVPEDATENEIEAFLAALEKG